jgi:GAF domain-containing protein
MTTSPGSWLDLLLSDAPEEAYAEHRARMLEGAHPAGAEHVEREVQQVHLIRSRLALLRQTADEMLVLNDLARRLASLRVPDEVLQEVAVQARRLLRVDVAYIMLLREDGVLRIEVAEGSIGRVLRGIELAPGHGLGGRVLLTGQPMWSESYLTDDRFTHDQSLDRAATSERLTGMLGVPLVVADASIGVLLAADRRERRFAAREVDLLAALASHAALAIRNATLFDQYDRATSELRESNLARQRAIDLRESLTAEVIAGGGAGPVLETLTRALGRPVWFFDARDELAHGPGPALAELTGGRGSAELFGTDEVATWERPGGAAVAARVLLPSGYVGCLVAELPGPASDDDRRSLSVGATSLALVVASERSVAEAELRTRGEFVHALLSPTADEASVRRRARASGADLDHVRTVLVLVPDPDDGGTPTRLCRGLASRLADELGGWSAEHDGRVVAFLAEPATDLVVARLRALHGGRLPGAAGLAPTTGGVRPVREAYETARDTAAVLEALGRPRDWLVSSELGIYRSLFSQSGRDEITEFVTSTIGPLVEHDREKGRDLCLTVGTFLEQAQHHAGTCALLHIHPNTLYQRLDRVTQLLGEDWRDPGRVLEIQIALTMRRLAERLATPDG